MPKTDHEKALFWLRAQGWALIFCFLAWTFSVAVFVWKLVAG